MKKPPYKRIWAAFITVAAFAVSMPDKFLELYKEFMHSGLTPAFAVALALWISKEVRNKRLDRRDARWESSLSASLQNDKIIMERLEVGEQWSNGLQSGLKRLPLSSNKLLKYLHKDIQLAKPQRRKKKMQFLKSNISKKLLAILVGAAVTALNKKFDLQLSESEIYVMFAGIITYLIGQSHVDAKKAIASTVTAVSQVVQASIVPNNPDVTSLSYNDMIPYIRDVNGTLMKCYEDMKSGRITDLTRDAMDTYLRVHQLLEDKKPPEPMPEIPIGA